MFQDEICSGMKYISCKDFIRNRRKVIQGIWRIRKDYIELFAADLKKLEHIMPDNSHILQSELSRLRSDEIRVQRQHLHAIYHRCSTGCELKGNGACTTKKVKHLQAFQLVFIIQHIEKSFSGKISRRSCLISLGRFDCLAFQTASDDPHIKSALRS